MHVGYRSLAIENHLAHPGAQFPFCNCNAVYPETTEQACHLVEFCSRSSPIQLVFVKKYKGMTLYVYMVFKSFF